MIAEDEQFHIHRNEFLDLNKKIQSAKSKSDIAIQDLRHAASLLGLLPAQQTDSLFQWLVQRNGLKEADKQTIEAAMLSKPERLAIIFNLFSSILTPGGELTFPIIGTAVTQSKSRYFYRGESAYYGSSKPTLYRLGVGKDSIQMDAQILTISEASYFLDQFDAVKRWSVSNVNYLALAQHYGLPTPMIDLTSDLKTALFFACCKYEHHRWRPLNRHDFSAHSGLKDPRYGILYRSPAEITDIKWVLSGQNSAEDLIMPIGYQPFMRCSAQHGYMLLTRNEHYDMMQDSLFDKFRFEHDEEFCRWIFDEMEQGAKIYPLDDIPHIEQFIEKIHSSHVISPQTFASLHLSDDQAYAFKRQLRQAGYEVLNHPQKYITKKALRKNNKRYSFKIACQKLDLKPVCLPLVHLPSNFLVDENQVVHSSS